MTAGDGSRIQPETEEQWTVTNSKIKTDRAEGNLKYRDISTLKRSGPLCENPPESKKSKVSNRERHIFVSKW